MKALLIGIALATATAGASVPSYWPGEDGRFSTSPTYNHRIYVIDTIGVRDRIAVREWHRCGADIRLVRGPRSMAEQPNTITILRGEKGDLPRGGWTGDHGIILLPPGAWERSLGTIRHEFGHALGFGHTGRLSVMGGSNHVQPLDCKGLRNYYG